MINTRSGGTRFGPFSRRSRSGRFDRLGPFDRRSRRRQRSRSGPRPVVVAAIATAGIAAPAALLAARLRRRTHPRKTRAAGAVTVSAGVTVNRPAQDAYALWRDFSRLPEFMTHLKSVSVDGTHWVATAPGGGTVGWDAEIVEEVPGDRLSWRSVDGADVSNAGMVEFTPAPGDRGTEVRVRVTYQPPAGRLGDAAARLLGEQPQQQVTDDLRRFKQLLETGEVVRSDGSPDGVRSGRLPAQRPGRPEGGEG